MRYYIRYTALFVCLTASSLHSTPITPGIALSFLRGLSTHTPTLLGYKSEDTAGGLFYIGINGFKYRSRVGDRESTINFHFDPHTIISLPVKILTAMGMGVGLGLATDKVLNCLSYRYRSTTTGLLAASLIGQAIGYITERLNPTS